MQFLGSRDGGPQGNGSTGGFGSAGAGGDVPIDDQDFRAAPVGVAGSPGAEAGDEAPGGDDDIPF